MIGARLKQLRGAVEKRNAVTQDSLVQELVESRAMALEDRNPSAANQATHLKARITGNISTQVILNGALTVEQSLAHFKTMGIEPVLLSDESGESE